MIHHLDSVKTICVACFITMFASVGSCSAVDAAIPKTFTELIEILLEDVKSGDQRLRVGVLPFGSAGGGESADALSTAAQLVRAEMENAFSKKDRVDLIARDRLADLELEGDFQNKKVEIKGVDVLSRGNIFYKGRTVAIHAELVFLDGRKKAASIEVDPSVVGLVKRAPEEVEMPPALASIRISDQTLFDIKITQVKIAGIQARLGALGITMTKEDRTATGAVLTKALVTRRKELEVAAEKVIDELEKLSALDRTIVAQSFAERRSELILKAAEQGLDTDLQCKLLGKFEGLYQQAALSGVKVQPSGVLDLTLDDEK
jgi:hypothetical protein